jgi:hypothetical protein
MVLRTHSETVCLPAFAATSIAFVSRAVKRTWIMRPMASPLGSLGLPAFLGLGIGIVPEILNDEGSYSSKGRYHRRNVEHCNVFGLAGKITRGGIQNLRASLAHFNAKAHDRIAVNAQ